MEFSAKVAVLAMTMAILPVAIASELDCAVVGLSDGDTFTCLDARKQPHKVRLANLDSPEKNQPFGAKAKQVLSSFIFKKRVRVDTLGFDRYQRMLGVVYVGDMNINREMVALGAAWVYPKYNRDQLLPSLESSAKSAGLGLWAQGGEQTVPPWEWRKKGTRLAAAITRPVTNQAVSSSSEACQKILCVQMTDCAEARFYLEQCGVTSLDKDRDGVPCENLCR